MPSYEPQQFETRRGECTIEGGVIRFEEGPTRAVRQAITGVREKDVDALGKPATVFFTLSGAVWAFQDLIVDVLDGRLWAVALGLLIVGAFGWQVSVWLKRWLFDPSAINCSDVESVTRIGEETLSIEYKDGPRRRVHDVKLSKKHTDDKRRLATRAFERKGFEVERAEKEKWYERVV